MKTIPVLKRFLFYSLFFIIQIILLIICSGLSREYPIVFYYTIICIFTFLIPNYIFAQCIANKSTIKAFFPIITSCISIIFVTTMQFFMCNSHYYTLWFVIFFFIAIFLPWEILYHFSQARISKSCPPKRTLK